MKLDDPAVVSGLGGPFIVVAAQKITLKDKLTNGYQAVASGRGLVLLADEIVVDGKAEIWGGNVVFVVKTIKAFGASQLNFDLVSPKGSVSGATFFTPTSVAPGDLTTTGMKYPNMKSKGECENVEWATWEEMLVCFNTFSQ